MQSVDRYEARSTGAAGRWQVWDRFTDTVVFGCDSMPELAAGEYARWLSEIYRGLYPDR
jgi:hypothetical protein